MLPFSAESHAPHDPLAPGLRALVLSEQKMDDGFGTSEH